MGAVIVSPIAAGLTSWLANAARGIYKARQALQGFEITDQGGFR
jgi:hypothetical protein